MHAHPAARGTLGDHRLVCTAPAAGCPAPPPSVKAQGAAGVAGEGQQKAPGEVMAQHGVARGHVHLLRPRLPGHAGGGGAGRMEELEV